MALSPSPPRPSAPGKDTTSPQRSGDFYLATSGDFLLATDGDFLMAMDISVVKRPRITTERKLSPA
ncbi:hypothetical protein MAV_3534 [Mycobacterium avium 104]|uniref:Uncharacterized protein n=1 Tax=Mycobacterium avium (strain 104) TaxID=243243 RepID=A0A0H2ZZ72_MYCA1|nr:hypothetical protein MAV_3534 [Mycobacterium avium 104]